MKTKSLIVGFVLGCGLMYLVLWSLGFRKQRVEWSLTEDQRKVVKSDISWFVQVEGYPELIYKDREVLSALSKPDRVTVYRVGEGGETSVADFGLRSGTVASEEDAEFFSKLVCSPTSMTAPSACMFSPGFAIRFEQGSTSFYALVCYSCRDIIFVDANGATVMGWGMSYEAAFGLIHRFYQLFPTDPEVQNLKF